MLLDTLVSFPYSILALWLLNSDLYPTTFYPLAHHLCEKFLVLNCYIWGMGFVSSVKLTSQ